MRDLESVTLSGRTVEVDLVIPHHLPRPVGIDGAVVAANLVRHQAAAGLQMTLHANFELAVTAEPSRIHNRLPYRFPRSAGGERRAHMCPSRPMTSLAINPFWN